MQNFSFNQVQYISSLNCTFYRLKDSSGWQLVFTSPYIESCIERVAINSKIAQNGGAGDASSSRMVAISYGNQIRLWGITEHGARTNIGEYSFCIHYILFILTSISIFFLNCPQVLLVYMFELSTCFSLVASW